MQSVLSPQSILIVICSYFILLFIISEITGRKSKSEDFYLGGRKSPWYLVAFGMIGASLSGVTFISVPGWVDTQQFSYMQMVLGYVVGYMLIATILLPIYYRLQLTSIYSYLEDRLGYYAYKTGASFFLISRIIGAAFRLYLVAIVLHKFVLEYYGFSFGVTVAITIILIWIYTFRGGIKTIVWTDTLQTASMLIAVGLSITAIITALDISWAELWPRIAESDYGQIYFFEGGWGSSQNFFKRFLAGASIAFVMTGLDQDMMQKNLSMRTLHDAQKNMFWFSMILVVVNLVFLMLGALLYMFAQQKGIEIPGDMVDGVFKKRTDLLYPTIALQHLSPIIGLSFVVGLIAAAYSSADSALTALTTSFCVDILGIEKSGKSVGAKKAIRWKVHVVMSIVLFIVIILFKSINNDAVISSIFTVATYTYGPLLGLYVFSIFTKYKVIDKWVPVICILSVLGTYIIQSNSEWLLFGYKFGFELLLLNGLLTFIGLFLFRKK